MAKLPPATRPPLVLCYVAADVDEILAMKDAAEQDMAADLVVQP